MMPAAPNFHQRGSLSLFYSQVSLKHLAAEFRNPCAALEMWLTVDFDLTTDPEKLAFVVSKSGEPETVDVLINRLNTAKNARSGILQVFQQQGITTASGVVTVIDQAYDGRFAGSDFLKFLDTVRWD